MSGTLVFLGIGFLLFGSLIILMFRPQAGTASLRQPEGNLWLGRPGLEDLRGELTSRIFGPEDSSFIQSAASKDVQRMFRKERRDLAFCWLSEVRRQTKFAMQIHVLAARKADNLGPLLELRLAIDYWAIQIRCAFIALVLLLQGPTGLRSMVAAVGGLSNQASDLIQVASRANTSLEKSNVQ